MTTVNMTMSNATVDQVSRDYDSGLEYEDTHRELPPITKYYLGYENDRNVRSGLMVIEIIKRAFGVDEVTFPGHHFVFAHAHDMQQLNIKSLNEMPSIDTLLFDHPIMKRTFGAEKAIPLMMRLAAVPCEERDEIVKQELAKLPPV